MTCEHGFIGACAECDGSGQSTEHLSPSGHDLAKKKEKQIMVDEHTIQLALELYQSTLEKTNRPDIAMSVVLSTMFDP